MRLPKFLTKDKLTSVFFIGAILLLLLSVYQCNRSVKLKSRVNEVVNTLNENDLKYQQLSKAFDSLGQQTAHFSETLPPGEVVEAPSGSILNTRRIIINESELIAERAANKRLRRQLEIADSINAAITPEQIAKGGAIIETVPVEETLPIVRTPVTKSGKNWSLYGAIFSRGPLEKYDFDVEVNPEKIIVEIPGKTTYLTYDNYLGISAGLAHFGFNEFDFDSALIPASVVFHRKWWGVEGGPLISTDLKSIEGAQLKLIAGFKFGKREVER